MRQGRQVALTFDACQLGSHSGYDGKIIATLRRYRAPATLFLGGKWALSHRNEARDLGADSLFEIEQHSFAHPNMTGMTAAQIATDLHLAQEAVRSATGRAPRYFRPPYGAYNPTVVRTARSMGLQTVLWTVVTGDPDKHVTAKAIAATVKRQARDGSVVIMHMNGRGWSTAQALPQLIEDLRKRGFALVKLSDLRRRDPAAFPQ